jgi:lipoprotein-anchoring transpeptidase ErfK/SrfK
MNLILSRRKMFMAFASLAVLPALAQRASSHALYGDDPDATPLRDETLLPPAESPDDFEIASADLSKIPPRFHRQIVTWEGIEESGTIVVDPGERFLFHVMDNGSAVRYGVGVGRAGFAWSGEAQVAMKRRWPRWVPPEDMVYRDANALKWVNGMPGGPENPLGARALYLYANGQDTLYRIHGTNDPSSIGKAMSSGCIRMLNEDVADLFERVSTGTKVVVLQASV